VRGHEKAIIFGGVLPVVPVTKLAVKYPARKDVPCKMIVKIYESRKDYRVSLSRGERVWNRRAFTDVGKSWPVTATTPSAMTPVGVSTVPLIAQSADIAGYKRDTDREDQRHDTMSFFIGEVLSSGKKFVLC
jgi:hypothetical protein